MDKKKTLPGREGTIDCKLYWYPNFYEHVLSSNGLTTLSTFIQPWLAGSHYQYPNFLTNLFLFRVILFIIIGGLHKLSSIVLSLKVLLSQLWISNFIPKIICNYVINLYHVKQHKLIISN